MELLSDSFLVLLVVPQIEICSTYLKILLIRIGFFLN